MYSENEVQDVDIRDAFLRIHETGLEAFNDYLTTTRNQALAAGKKRIIFHYGKVKSKEDRETNKTEQEAYIVAHPELAEMHLADGSNLLHVIGIQRAGLRIAALTLAKKKPSLLEEKAGELQFTPAFSFLITDSGDLLWELLDSYDPANAINRKEMDAVLAAQGIQHDTQHYLTTSDQILNKKKFAQHQSTKRRNLLNAKDAAELGLPFYCAAHGGNNTLTRLAHHGIDIFTGFEKEGATRGAAIANQPNIIGAACAKFFQQADSDKDNELIHGIAEKYINEFGVDALRALVASDVRLYAPMLGVGYSIDDKNGNKIFSLDDIKTLLSTLPPKQASTVANHVIKATYDEQSEMAEALDPIINYLQGAGDLPWTERHKPNTDNIAIRR